METTVQKIETGLNGISVKEFGGVRNQYTIQTSKGIIFQSYLSIIAIISSGKVYLDEQKWDYSKTTGKYRNQFLGESKKETEKKIKSGEYILANLNN
jgi:hypothetical protein